MERLKDGLNRIPKDREDVEVYLLKLQYALRDKSTLIDYQEERYADRNRQIKYTNAYTMGVLFPNEPPSEVLKRELGKLRLQEYIETIKDTRYPKRSDLWVFGKQYMGKDVFIKFRVEILPTNYIFVLSFHFSTVPFSKVSFPFAK